MTGAFDDVQTPSLVLDVDRLKRNIARGRARADALGVRLRPHLKTCKSVDVARLLVGDDAIAAVSTLAEAKAFIEAGVRRLRITAPFAPNKAAVVAPWVADGVDFEILLDDPASAAAVADAAERAGATIAALIEIDVDGARGGVRADDPRFAALLETIRTRPGLDFAGLYVYGGATYGLVDRAARVKRIETLRAAGAGLAASLRADGIDCRTVGIGGSPVLAAAPSLEGFTEACAGVFVFQDLAQCAVGVAALDDVAVDVLATVAQHKPDAGALFVDAGGLALSCDRSTAAYDVDQGYGLVCDVEGTPVGDGDVVVASVSQEHGRVARRDGSPPPFYVMPVGATVRILPNHACMTAAAYEDYLLVENGAPTGARWPRGNGWAA
ncbi:MAG: alanine racemase [Parvularculaceae bacterium]